MSTNGHSPQRGAALGVPFDLGALKYEALASRASKVALADLGRAVAPGATIGEWLESLPRLLGADSLLRLRDAIEKAWRGGRPVVAALGGHVVKTGCAPYLIDWIDRGVLHGLALNGSAAIHDLELAIAGKTSEDVGGRLLDGNFGFAHETSELFTIACAAPPPDRSAWVRRWATWCSSTAGPDSTRRCSLLPGARGSPSRSMSPSAPTSCT